MTTSKKHLSLWERREISATDKQIKAIDRVAEVYMEKRRKREMRERATIYCTLFFGTVIIISLWLTEGRLIDGVAKALQSVEDSVMKTSTNPALNCRNPKNRNTPYCQKKYGKKKSEWSNMTILKDEDKNQFTLHSRGK